MTRAPTSCNFTYANEDVLEQPRQFAWQVYDAKVHHLLRDEYRIREITKVTADTLRESAAKMDGVDAAGFLKTVEEFNSSVPADAPPFNPNVLDGRHTVGLPVIKSSNPGSAHRRAAVRGVRDHMWDHLHIRRPADEHRRRGDQRRRWFDSGTLCGGRDRRLGGLFYFNYPSGSGLTGGAVFGRIAGAKAAQSAEKNAVR